MFYSYDTRDQLGICRNLGTAGIGRLCARNDEGGNHTYDYDFFGNIVNMTRTELGITYTESTVYDQGDNPIQCTYPTGRTVNFSRDGIRRINAISSNGANIINSMTYRGDSRMITRQWQNGLNETRSYDQQARVTQISLGNTNRDYRYDASSNIISINSPFHTGNYGYDQNDRLTQEQLNANTQNDFNYDFNGNRLQKLINAGESTENYRYEQNSNKLLNTDLVAPDEATSEISNREFIHNDADRIRSIMVDNQAVGTYYYNDMGLRSRKEIPQTDGSTETTIYHYNMVGSLIAETNATGQVQKEYIWNDMEPVAQIDNEITYLHSDHLYTPRRGTDDLQTTVWQWESNAFGSTNPQIETTEVNLRFLGQYQDEETDLHYNWNRYYDPQTGRYVTSDPIGLDGGINTYGYVGGNPLTRMDPEGLYWVYVLRARKWVWQWIGKKPKPPKPPKAPKPPKKGTWSCICKLRLAPSDCEAECPPRVAGLGLTKNAAQNAAKNTAPRRCRQYYGHCECRKK